MKKLNALTLGAVLTVSACGINAPTAHSPELEEYAVWFEETASEHGHAVKAVPMVVVDNYSVGVRAGKSALCIKSRGKAWVEFSRSHFKSMSRFKVMSTVLHEQGHCVFGLEHDDSKPAIMNSSAPLSPRKVLVDELFDTVKK